MQTCPSATCQRFYESLLAQGEDMGAIGIEGLGDGFSPLVSRAQGFPDDGGPNARIVQRHGVRRRRLLRWARSDGAGRSQQESQDERKGR